MYKNTDLTRSKLEIIAFSVSLAIIIFLSLCGNFLLISAFIRSRRLRYSFANKLIMSLAVTDFMTAAFPLSYQLSTVIDVKLISHGGLLCQLGGMASYAFYFISLATLVMLSVDRFIALGFPLRYRYMMNQRVKVAMVSFPWCHGTLFVILCVSFMEIKFHLNGFDCGLEWSSLPMVFNLGMLMIYLGIPLILLTVLNTWTLILVRGQNKRILDYRLRDVQSSSTCRAKEASNRRATIESRLAMVSIIIIFVFLVCWAPYAVTRALESLGFQLSSVTMSGSVWAAHASTFVNPMIYSSLRADLRREMFRIFRRTRTYPVANLRVVTITTDF